MIGWIILWLIPWLFLGFGVGIAIMVGGNYDITTRDEHYTSSGTYVGYTRRKTGEGYTEPAPRTGRNWIILTFVAYVAITCYFKWTPYHWLQTEKEEAAQEAIRSAETARGAMDGKRLALSPLTGDTLRDTAYLTGFSNSMTGKLLVVQKDGAKLARWRDWDSFGNGPSATPTCDVSALINGEEKLLWGVPFEGIRLIDLNGSISEADLDVFKQSITVGMDLSAVESTLGEPTKSEDWKIGDGWNAPKRSGRILRWGHNITIHTEAKEFATYSHVITQIEWVR